MVGYLVSVLTKGPTYEDRSLHDRLARSLLCGAAVAQESSREDFQKFCEAWKGRWVGDVTWVADWPAYGKRGDKVTAYVEINVAEDGNALTGRLFGGKGSATVVGFYDAAAKQIKWLWVNSGGAVDQALISMKDGKWTFHSTGSLADGTKTESASTVTISDNGNLHTWTGTGKVGDKKTDDQHDVWRRVSR